MDRRILLLREQMLSNLQYQPTVEELANKVNVSASHLQKLFKAETGVSPIQFLQNMRLEKARELLEKGFKRVKEVGVEVGITDQSNFAREFKQKHGFTPLEYRRQHWAKLEAGLLTDEQ
jgi:transcriptional regulator GlxA family with amidase domain